MNHVHRFLRGKTPAWSSSIHWSKTGSFLCFPATPCVYLFQPYKELRLFELNTSMIQYNCNGRRENGDEICSPQFGFYLVSRQKVHLSWKIQEYILNGKWLQNGLSGWPVQFDLLKTEKIINITVRMNRVENGLWVNQLGLLNHPHRILLY